MRNTDVLQLELEVGQTLFIGNVAVTIIDSEGDEVHEYFATLPLAFVQLESTREPIPDVPAVYFCRPTPENLKRIAQDCRFAPSLHNLVVVHYGPDDWIVALLCSRPAVKTSTHPCTCTSCQSWTESSWSSLRGI